MRGARWVVGTTNHGAWLGTYERDKQILFSRALKPGFTVWDVGANVGFYTLLAARIVGATGKVSAFEPLPSNVRALRRHLDLNGVATTTVVEAAVADREGALSFKPAESNAEGRLEESGRMKVKCIRLDDYWKTSGESPKVLKMDIEGGEEAALSGGKEFLAACRPLIFLATHGAAIHARCCDLLRGIGYSLSSVNPTVPIESTDELLCRWAGTNSPGDGC